MHMRRTTAHNWHKTTSTPQSLNIFVLTSTLLVTAKSTKGAPMCSSASRWLSIEAQMNSCKATWSPIELPLGFPRHKWSSSSIT